LLVIRHVEHVQLAFELKELTELAVNIPVSIMTLGTVFVVVPVGFGSSQAAHFCKESLLRIMQVGHSQLLSAGLIAIGGGYVCLVSEINKSKCTLNKINVNVLKQMLTRCLENILKTQEMS